MSSNSRVVAVERKIGRWPVWMEIAIGGVPKMKITKLAAFEHCAVNEEAGDLMAQEAFTVSRVVTALSIAKVEVGELGFTSAPTTPKLFSRRRLNNLGLDILPSEAGPRIMACYMNRHDGDTVVAVAMDPIVDSRGRLRVFELNDYSDGPAWRPVLDTHVAGRNDEWGLGTELALLVLKR